MRLELWWLGVRGLCLEREGEEAVALPVAFYTAASSHRPTDPDGRNTEHDHGRANPTDTMAPSLECAWPWGFELGTRHRAYSTDQPCSWCNG